MQSNPFIYVAVPCMDEMEYLPEFIDCIKGQNIQKFKLFICVNQPDHWWKKEDKIKICENNRRSLEYLNSITDINIEIIDKSSEGKGWTGKKHGVGWARKTIIDKIIEEAKDEDIVISLDADTTFKEGYFESIVENFRNNGDAVAISVPYYHKLTGDAEKDRAILRYEIYMRYYAINLYRTGNPYGFTAIGSAIALPVKSYKAISGITPHKSGEDFYFLQKLRKYGKIITWNNEKVYPAARYSERVGFGTGPAMIKGRTGDWSGYPIFPFEYFDEVAKTYSLFPQLFVKNIKTPMDGFIFEKFGNLNIWQPLRKNNMQVDKFVKACYHKIDAFRIFQYLKWRYKNNKHKDEANLIRWFKKFYQVESDTLPFNLNKLSFLYSPVIELDEIRNLLMKIEDSFRKNN